ncbi:hypothetical protein EXE48_04190 [Halorubrum sp. ASP1]|nr:hypothetical protein EXE48_04190 [Halorubrum sp. ASP1]
MLAKATGCRRPLQYFRVSHRLRQFR